MRLEIGRDGESGRTVEWTGDRPLVIGRGRDSDFPLQDPLLSRRHCQLELIEGRIWASDLGSANGTYINSNRITRTALGPSDLLTFGNFWLRLAQDQPTLRKRRSDSGSGDESGRRGAGEGAPPFASPPLASPPPPLAPDPAIAASLTAAGRPLTPPRVVTSADDTDSGHPRIDGYEVVAVIGQGSFGKVFRARLLDDDRGPGAREVALKVLPTGPTAKAEVVARFLREIEATGQLSHPNLVGVLGAGEGEGFAYLVMEYVPGDTLAKKLQKAGKLEPLRALAIARQIASGLDHAFSRGFVHRDVKPENILVDERGTAKLCDFGLVKSLGHSAQQGLTRPGQGFGSVAYMPPEQVKSAYAADQRADIYSVGATLYHMLTGKRPFSGQVTKSLLKRVLEEMPEPILDFAPECPRPVIHVVERCLQKDPDARYQTPAELLAAIDACIGQLETGIGPAVRSVRNAVTVVDRPAWGDGDGVAVAAAAPAPLPAAAARTPATPSGGAPTVREPEAIAAGAPEFGNAPTDRERVPPGFTTAATESDRVAPGSVVAGAGVPSRKEEDALADFALDVAVAPAPAPAPAAGAEVEVRPRTLRIDPPDGVSVGGANLAPSQVSAGPVQADDAEATMRRGLHIAAAPGAVPAAPASAPPGRPGLLRRIFGALFRRRQAGQDLQSTAPPPP